MKDRIIVTAAVLSLALAAPAAAEIVDYSDDYVSFSYDDEMIGEIWKFRLMEDSPLMYSFVSGIKKDALAECYFGVAKKEKDTSVEESENRKVLLETDDYCAYLHMSDDIEDDAFAAWAKVFFDSFSLSADMDTLLAGSSIDETVYLNVELSDQCRKYAEGALETLNGYMDMSVSEDDAVAAIEDLQSRIDSYVEESDYYFDSKLKNELFLTNLTLMQNDDGEIQKTIDELQKLIGEDPAAQ